MRPVPTRRMQLGLDNPVRFVRRGLWLAVPEIACALGVPAGQIVRWERACHPHLHEVTRQRLSLLLDIMYLGNRIYPGEGFRDFLLTPAPCFGGNTPRDLIAAAQLNRVRGVLAANYGSFG